MRKFLLAAAIIGFAAVQAGGQDASAALAVNVLKGPISAAISSAVPSLQHPEPFVDALAAYLNDQREPALADFLTGLTSNNITDPTTVNTILNAMETAGSSAALFLALTGKNSVALQVQGFVSFISGSQQLMQWSAAVASGQTVRIEGDQVAVVSSRSAPAELDVPRHPNEVTPVLNIIHGQPGAEVLLDDEKVAVSKYEQYTFQNLTAGKHIIVVQTAAARGAVEVFVNPSRQTQAGYDEIPLSLAPRTFTLVINSPITGADVLVDGARVGSTPLMTPVAVGTHKVALQSPWMDTFTQTVSGTADARVVVTPTSRQYGTVSLSEALPAGASLVIDGTAADTLPLKLPSGTHRYAVSAAETATYRAASGSFFVLPGQQAAVTPLAYKYGTVVLQGAPYGCDAVIDGATKLNVGIVASSSNVVAGQHVLTLVFPGNEGSPFTQSVTVEEGRATTVSVPTGRLSFAHVASTIPISLNAVAVNSQVLSPVEGGLLSPLLLPGTYHVLYNNIESGIATVTAGQTTPVTFPVFHAKLSIHGIPAGYSASLNKNGVDTARFGSGVGVDPGTYDVAVSSPAGQRWIAHLTLNEGEVKELNMQQLVNVIPSRTMKINTDPQQWAGIVPQFDGRDGKTTTVKGFIIKDVSIAADDKNLYVKYDLDDDTQPTLFTPYNFSTDHGYTSYGLGITEGSKYAYVTFVCWKNQWHAQIGAWYNNAGHALYDGQSYSVSGSTYVLSVPLKVLTDYLGQPSVDTPYKVNAFSTFFDPGRQHGDQERSKNKAFLF